MWVRGVCYLSLIHQVNCTRHKFLAPCFSDVDFFSKFLSSSCWLYDPIPNHCSQRSFYTVPPKANGAMASMPWSPPATADSSTVAGILIARFDWAMVLFKLADSCVDFFSVLYRFVRFRQQFCSIKHGTSHSHRPTSLPYPYQTCSSFSHPSCAAQRGGGARIYLILLRSQKLGVDYISHLPILSIHCWMP